MSDLESLPGCLGFFEAPIPRERALNLRTPSGAADVGSKPAEEEDRFLKLIRFRESQRLGRRLLRSCPRGWGD